jgi:hypothetical protein
MSLTLRALRPPTTRGLVSALGIAVVLVASVTLGAAQNQIADRQRSDHFWRHLWFHGGAAIDHQSLAQLNASSDAVVLGRIERVDVGRIFGSPHPDNPNPEDERVHYANLRIAVESVLLGDTHSTGELLQLEVPLPRTSTIDDVQGGAVPGERSVFWIFNAGLSAAEQGHPAEYVARQMPYSALVQFGAVVRDLDGRAAPLLGAEMEFLESFDGLAFSEFLETVTNP